MLYDEHGIFIGEVYEDEEQDLMHYGTPRHSGRYPWGSGENPYQRNESFLGKVDALKKAIGPDGKKLYTEKQVAAALNMNTSELRKRIALATAENHAYLVSEAKRLKEKGMSNSAIGRRMGKNESSIRLLLDEGVTERMSKLQKNADILKDRVEKLEYIDVGKGTEQYLGISSTSFNNALHSLEKKGYMVHDVYVEQMGTGKMTTMKVLTKPGVDTRDVYKAAKEDKIKMIKDVYSEDGGQTMRSIEPPVSVDPKRIMINYAETGGKDKDGVIELRRDVPDISLGKARYAQVRILVDDTHYLKGMAMYADDLPDGVDIRFNTNKHEGTPMINKEHPKECVLKPIKEGFENPFGANIKEEDKLILAQRHYIGEDGKEHLSALNVVSDEGTWYNWNRTLASQFLSKQPPALAKKQLKMAYDISKADFDEIATYTNPVVKAQMLEDFAGRCESDAVHLKAAALPRQSTRVILPLPNDLRENEIYAPGYRDGEEVVLVRYPHASITEIPRLTVNNSNKHAKEVIGDAMDAVGIHPAAAARLSGADFDGDTVLVLPTTGVNIRNKPQFESLKNIDLEEKYPKYPGMHVMSSAEKGNEMGRITNLITDMTFQGASDKELERALLHSMVVIDAEKHELDYKRSERENRIQELKDKYQNGGGASSLLSRSTSEEHIPERKEKAFSKMTPEEQKRYLNGEMIYVDTGKTKRFRDYMPSRMTKEERVMWKSGDPDQMNQVRAAMNTDGRVRVRDEKVTVKVNKGELYDPYSLATGGSKERTTQMERVYAEHVLAMKELAREARKMARNQGKWEVDKEAQQKYAREVDSLNSKLSKALMNAPLERQAQLKANKAIRDILQNNPDLASDSEHYSREKGRQLDKARKLVGAKKLLIGGSDKNPLTDREWEAIEHHAVSKTTLQRILANADKNRVRELAMPRTKTGISAAKLASARSMLKNGYSRADVCDILDISEGKLIDAIGMENF